MVQFSVDFLITEKRLGDYAITIDTLKTIDVNLTQKAPDMGLSISFVVGIHCSGLATLRL
jgi:hypothetical protein